jgi:hypothetical protein
MKTKNIAQKAIRKRTAKRVMTMAEAILSQLTEAAWLVVVTEASSREIEDW